MANSRTGRLDVADSSIPCLGESAIFRGDLDHVHLSALTSFGNLELTVNLSQAPSADATKAVWVVLHPPSRKACYRSSPKPFENGVACPWAISRECSGRSDTFALLRTSNMAVWACIHTGCAVRDGFLSHDIPLRMQTLRQMGPSMASITSRIDALRPCKRISKPPTGPRRKKLARRVTTLAECCRGTSSGL